MSMRERIMTLIESVDPNEMAEHSSINHHVNGLSYLCLQREPQAETIKLYYLARPYNPNSGFLVNPHTHRYQFDTEVLLGRVKHIRFRERERPLDHWQRPDWARVHYAPSSPLHMGLLDNCRAYLRQSEVQYCEEGDSYRVLPHEIHTLQMYDDGKPLILGLVQLPDECEGNVLYLPANEYPEMRRPDTGCMTTEQYRNTLWFIQQYLESPN